MEAADFILIQVHKEDKFFELARIRPYMTAAGCDDFRGFFCEGFAQNNGKIYEFSLHLGRTEAEIPQEQEYIIIGYPTDPQYDGRPVSVVSHVRKRKIASI
jgi:hypothetical protein